MSSLGGIGAAAVTTIGTLAVVGMAAKVANGVIKNTGGYRRSHAKKHSSKRSARKSYSIWD